MSQADTTITAGGSSIDDRKNDFIKYVFFSCAFVTVLTTLGIILVLIQGSIEFFQHVSIVEYLTGTNWSPVIRPYSYGVLPLVWGTLIITVGSALIAIPVGTATAIYLSEYAEPRVRKVIKPTLEILAGIPTIVYGFFALSFITPVIQLVFPQTGTFNAAAGAIVVGIMIIPMVSSLSEDAMSSVPDELRNAAYGLGATKFEVSTNVVVPASLSGVVASYILALSRAIGETMAVTLAVGMTPQITANPLDSIQTMTAYMVQIGISDVSVDSIGYQSLFAVGLTLFILTLAMNMISLWVKSRYREEYQ
ncbi:phosphate ABC transporter permease subunit PstC [Natronorubrum bangense]|uniref:Phosphate transport system permease protein n=2 Tax=Natronorubrum bangense TaxID=61858 RepID=L9WWA2_9EURY|nr:phosphate ABC transporter permease subunit PstC [Natronorubrum bangense]ELY52618.1 phosphate ABC transporter permease [Natronorubrum bangense JCM 10635]QCC55079.1 phosphate ABC transporter permease subunit PstC [Natronorubrum bangense]